MNKQEYKNLIAFHPGYYIKEMIEDINMTQSEFAKRLGTTDKTVSKLINGEISLSDEIAQKLSSMLGTSGNHSGGSCISHSSGKGDRRDRPWAPWSD